MKKLIIFAFAGICLMPLRAVASPVVRTVKQSQASGSTAIVQTIKVWNGNGVSISFYEVSEIVKRVWIDDPSQILIDTDGCLEGINPNCQSPGAGLIHLRRIQKVNIPGLPQAKSTHLTIITQATDGRRKAYHFQVTAAAGKPEYSQIAIEGDISYDSIERTPVKLNPRRPRALSNVRLPLK
ncbi:hypothetical protein FNW02_32285 [Komarekiella sp. 'clone 1']|uniref:Uncharacterized protein n=1 Tax=Komarekiella delphini-convector SJRDD-AB1 TaxID=2593771 RepID=A0AA40VUM1_9NOST|nr:hypothetical protein [Komarekiella delphini-convector]MBD6620337.1 hypothetical protein [Komarekiella delphini-convector SJRDD-AB1]